MGRLCIPKVRPIGLSDLGAVAHGKTMLHLGLQGDAESAQSKNGGCQSSIDTQ